MCLEIYKEAELLLHNLNNDLEKLDLNFPYIEEFLEKYFRNNIRQSYAIEILAKNCILFGYATAMHRINGNDKNEWF